MNVYLAKEYGAQNSAPVFDAFERGILLAGDSVVDDIGTADAVVIWSWLFAGRMSGNRMVLSRAIEKGIPVIVLEVGALKRGDSWKVGINGINNAATWCDPFQPNRFYQFGIFIPAWKTDGEFITIFTQRPDSNQWAQMPPMDAWLRKMLADLRDRSDRPIVVRPHPRDKFTRFNFIRDFKDVYFDEPQHIDKSYDSYNHQYIMDRTFIAVNYSSGPGVQAALDGTHILCGEDSLAWDVSLQSIDAINEPPERNRKEWLQKLAHTEFFTDEMASGIVWQNLKKKL